MKRSHQPLRYFRYFLRKAYTWGLAVTWNWDRFPSFLAFCVGWVRCARKLLSACDFLVGPTHAFRASILMQMLLATNEYMRTHPSRWKKVPSFFEFLERLAYNAANPENIPKDFEIEKLQAHDSAAKDEEERLKKQNGMIKANEDALQLELGQEIEKTEKAEKVGKKDGGILSGLDPLRPILYPIQQQLHQVVVALRIAKCIVLWNEAYYSFWLATACFLISAVSLWIPWSFVLRWMFRLVVMFGLGPWMAIVDEKYFKKPVLSKEEREEDLRQRLQKRTEEVLNSAKNYFQRKETAVKLKGMKDYMVR
jgi:hypothetical protein